MSTGIYLDDVPPGRYGVQPLRAMLQAAGVTLEDAAPAVGVTPEFLSMVTNGRSRPSLPVAARLARLVGSPIEECFSASMLGLPRRRR
ncbi:MAG: helix-turn-helix domain-containing protein [Acidimicrobiales bacterium]